MDLDILERDILYFDILDLDIFDLDILDLDILDLNFFDLESYFILSVHEIYSSHAYCLSVGTDEVVAQYENHSVLSS